MCAVPDAWREIVGVPLARHDDDQCLEDDDSSDFGYDYNGIPTDHLASSHIVTSPQPPPAVPKATQHRLLGHYI